MPASRSGTGAAPSWWKAGRLKTLKLLLERFPAPPGPACDFGCGEGEALALLGELPGVSRAVGVDADVDAVAVCQARGLEVVCGTERCLPELGPFSLAVAMDVLEHVEDDTGAARTLFAVLVPGGRLVVSAPAHPWLYSYHDRALGHLRRYSRRDLAALLAASGFEVEFLGWQCLAGFAAAPFVRALRSLAGADTADDGFAAKPPAPAQRLLSKWSLWEAGLAAAGRIPVGLTLWAVATKPRP
ncbi:MAG: class I SAM-dependent methyltransferase [Moorellales bacterium]